MPLPQLSAAPPAPSRLDNPATFVTKADVYLAWLTTLRNELVVFIAELPAQITGTDFSGSSATSIAVGMGSKVFTASTGKQWQIGQPVRVAYTTTPSNYMDGQVTAYNSVTGSLTVNVTAVGGAGTWANWTISLIPGAGAAFATKDGVETFTNKTLTGNIIASFVNGAFTITMPASTTTLVGHNTANVLTNKSIDFGGNTIVGTIAQFNAALSDGDFATLGGTETLAGKTMTSPTVNGGTLRGDVAVSDGGTIAAGSVGFRGIPRSANTSGTVIASDNGKYVPVTVNIALPVASALPDGFSCEIVNESGSPITITSTDTLRWSGTATTGNRTLAAYGRAAIGRRGSAPYFVSGDVS